MEVDRLDTILADDGESELAWTNGDRGFEMVLSSAVPRILEQQIDRALRPVLGPHSADPVSEPNWGGVEQWAIHPGGRTVESALFSRRIVA